MKTRTLVKLVASLFLSALVFVGCNSAAPAGIKTGDKVVALWSGTSWYEGTVDVACDKGFSIKWADGTPASCVVASKITADKAATKDNLKVGTPVYAKWMGVAFYEATISAVGDTYSVNYADGSKKDSLTLADLRLK